MAKLKQYKIALLITAGGSSVRFGRNKLLENIAGKPVIFRTIDAFSGFEFSQKVITVSQDLKQALIKTELPEDIELIDGGKNRQESVFNGLKALNNDTDFVIIHDGARPLIKPPTVEKCLFKAIETGAAIVAVSAVDTIKEVDNTGKIVSTPCRENLRYVQTPQIFDFGLILGAHKKFEGENFSDDAGLLEAMNIPVFVMGGEYSNIKITTESDIIIAEGFLR